MSDQVGTLGKSIVEFYISNWWQLFLGCFLGGFVSALSLAVWIRNVSQIAWYGSLIRFLLYLAAATALERSDR
jgi:hypothetical protein